MFKKIKNWFMKIIGDIKIYAWPMFVVYNPHTFSVKGKHYYQARDIILPGDLVLRSYKQYLNAYLIPGEYSHVGIYVGGPEEKIIHAVSPEVEFTNLAHFMRCDEFAIVRPLLSDEEKEEAIERAVSKLGVPYDSDFIFEVQDHPDRLFSCSELCYHAYQNHVEKLGWRIMNHNFILFKKELFTPGDILPQNENSTIVMKI